MNKALAIIAIGLALYAGIAFGIAITLNSEPIVKERQRNERVREINANYGRTLDTVNHWYERISQACKN